jgi:hypothetical protein
MEHISDVHINCMCLCAVSKLFHSCDCRPFANIYTDFLSPRLFIISYTLQMVRTKLRIHTAPRVLSDKSPVGSCCYRPNSIKSYVYKDFGFCRIIVVYQLNLLLRWGDMNAHFGSCASSFIYSICENAIKKSHNPN